MISLLKGAGAARYIGGYIPPQLLTNHSAYQVPFSPEARGHLTTNPIVVKECVKSAGRVLVPGSSIKGAIFSALLFEVLTEQWQAGQTREAIGGLLKNKDDNRQYNDLLNLVFRDFSESPSKKQQGRFMHWIDVSDSSLGYPEDHLRIFLTRVEGARSDSSLPIVIEALDLEKNFQLEIKTTGGFRWSAEDLLKIADRFYRLVWMKTNGGAPVPGEGALIRIGQGSSAYTTSLLIFAEQNMIGQDIYRFLPPRTSKQVVGDGGMGWVILSPSEETSIQKALAANFPASKPLPEVGEPLPTKKEILEVWDKAQIRWTPNDQTLSGTFENKKAFSKAKELVPGSLRKPLFDKKKSVTAKVEVKPIGNSFEIVKIIE